MTFKFRYSEKKIIWLIGNKCLKFCLENPIVFSRLSIFPHLLYMYKPLLNLKFMWVFTTQQLNFDASVNVVAAERILNILSAMHIIF